MNAELCVYELDRIKALLLSLLSEEGMRDKFLCYNVGAELIRMVEK